MKILNIVALMCILSTVAFAAEFQVDKSSKNLVKFISDAPLEDFEGKTDKIDGYIFWEGDDLTNKSEIYFEVDLKSIDTGIGLRNRHMRENYLHTDKYPITHYKGMITRAEKTDGENFNVVTEGTIFIHGVERKLTASGEIVNTGENGYQIITKFEVKLPDFNIEVPQLMFMKINEVIKLELTFFVKLNDTN
ncbi:MAG: YceI family protein [Calditrichaceae bacterium]